MTEVAEFLTEKGCKIEWRGESGMIPLMLAASLDRQAIAEARVARGASVESQGATLSKALSAGQTVFAKFLVKKLVREERKGDVGYIIGRLRPNDCLHCKLVIIGTLCSLLQQHSYFHWWRGNSSLRAPPSISVLPERLWIRARARQKGKRSHQHSETPPRAPLRRYRFRETSSCVDGPSTRRGGG